MAGDCHHMPHPCLSTALGYRLKKNNTVLLQYFKRNYSISLLFLNTSGLPIQPYTYKQLTQCLQMNMKTNNTLEKAIN